MDNNLLAPLLTDDHPRQCWIKPVGDPKNPLKAGARFDRAVQQIDFAKRPNGIKLDDLLFVYAVGESKLLYIADCYTPPREASEQEQAQEEWRKRWSWSFRGHNFTPTYGSQWWNHALRPFDLLKEYNALQADDEQSLGSINFGADKQRISLGFAHFIIQKVMSL